MELNDHLIYLDITNLCGLGCDHCMYKNMHEGDARNLVLNDFAKKNLASMINDSGTAQVVISGEGEPFKNEKAIWDILALSKGNRRFQIVTNGVWINDDLSGKLSDMNAHAGSFGDKYSIRISIDSYHAKRLQYDKYLKFLDVASTMNGRWPDLSLEIRSIMEDRAFVLNLMTELLKQKGISYEMNQSSPLDDTMHFPNGCSLKISYRNIVRPAEVGNRETFSINEYITATEKKYGKDFTLGNLSSKRAQKGLDLTIKPEGDVFFYGIEISSFGNIFKNELNMTHFASLVDSNPILHKLYCISFREVLARLSQDPFMSEQIEKINNPYWVIRTLYSQHKSKILNALGLT